MQGAEEMTALACYSLRSFAVRNAGYAALGSAFFLLVVALAWWLPARHEHAGLEQAIDLQRAATVEAVRSAEVMRAQHEAKQSVALLERKLEVSARQADLIDGIAKLAARRGARVVAQAFDEGREQRNDGSLFMDVGLVGSYAAVRGMVGDLATLPMWVEVVEARLDRSSDSGAPIRAQLRLLTYRTPRQRS
jgi:Tfp pilus assembly protein PilO